MGAKYEAMLAALGPEFSILREVPLEDIRAAAGPCVAEGIRRLRAGQVVRKPGVRRGLRRDRAAQPRRAGGPQGAGEPLRVWRPQGGQDRPGQGSEARTERGGRGRPHPGTEWGPSAPPPRRREATVAVLAGPGTGKTHTLVERVVWLVEERGPSPPELTAVTFTNRAAGELRARLEGRLGKRAARAMTIGTFHAICLELLGDVPLAGPYEQRAAAAAALAELGRKGSHGAFLPGGLPAQDRSGRRGRPGLCPLSGEAGGKAGL